MKGRGLPSLLTLQKLFDFFPKLDDSLESYDILYWVELGQEEDILILWTLESEKGILGRKGWVGNEQLRQQSDEDCEKWKLNSIPSCRKRNLGRRFCHIGLLTEHLLTSHDHQMQEASNLIARLRGENSHPEPRPKNYKTRYWIKPSCKLIDRSSTLDRIMMIILDYTEIQRMHNKGFWADSVSSLIFWQHCQLYKYPPSKLSRWEFTQRLANQHPWPDFAGTHLQEI